ncbi:hypothetical protein FISHEDRAFT_71430 [Fistulina hepatica ATCC 64428]|nr:hypothetical protein FISHEDRAFT_71430 [Fistulina hepatica ATCC 64428]
MSVLDIVSGFGIPGLGFALQLVTETEAAVGNISVYRRKCGILVNHCAQLIDALQAGSVGLETHKAADFALELEMRVIWREYLPTNIISCRRLYRLLTRVKDKTFAWSVLSPLRSLLRQDEIRHGIEDLREELRLVAHRFHINMSLEHLRLQQEAARDQAELRDLLLSILRSNRDMNELVNQFSVPQAGESPVDTVMGMIQTELRPGTSPLPSTQRKSMQEGLRFIRDKTDRLPPLADLTGQIIRTSNARVETGSYMDVYQGGIWLDKETVALGLPKQLANDQAHHRRFQRQVDVWRGIKHENVLPLYGVYYEDSKIFTVSPWMDNGTLLDYVQQHPNVNRFKLLYQAARGVEYLHRQDIVHGDIRCANILVNKEGVARVSYFGLSKFLAHQGGNLLTYSDPNPRWSAPELLHAQGQFSTQSDVWSMAMACLELLTGKPPFYKFDRSIAVLNELSHSRIPERPRKDATHSELCDELWGFVRKCWHKKPSHRPSMYDFQVKLGELCGGRNLSPVPFVHDVILAELAPLPKSSGKRTPWIAIPGIRRPSTSSSHQTSSIPSIPEGPVFPSSISYADPFNATPPSIGDIIPFGDFRLSPLSPSSSTATYPLGSFSDAPERDLLGPQSLPKDMAKYIPPRLREPPLRSTVETSTHPATFDPSIMFENSDSPSRSSSSIRLDPSVNSTGWFVNEFIDSSGMLFHLFGKLLNVILFMLPDDSYGQQFRDVFLIVCAEIIGQDVVLDILTQRLREAGQLTDAKERVATRFKIYSVLLYWVAHRRLRIAPSILERIQEFCTLSQEGVQAETVRRWVNLILTSIEGRRRADTALQGSAPLSPGRPALRTSDITPVDLAIALTILEGDNFRRTYLSDYVSNLLDSSGSQTRLQHSALLHDIQKRASSMVFFINTAVQCRSRRNFSSMAAIASALSSTPIENMTLVKRYFPEPKNSQDLDSLVRTIDPHSNHQAYRVLLNESSDSHGCVPWIAVHLRELKSIFNANDISKKESMRPENFERYVKLFSRLKGTLCCDPPELEMYRNQGTLVYLQRELSVVHPCHEAERLVIRQSDKLVKMDRDEDRSRVRQLSKLGFGPKPCSGSVIAKGTLRMGSQVDFRGNTTFAWRHWGCATPKVIANLREAVEGDAAELDGFEDLKEEDKARVIKAFQEGHVAEEDIPETAKNPSGDDKDEEIEDEKPKKKVAARREPAKRKAATKKKAEDDEGVEDKPTPKRATNRKAQKEASDDEAAEEGAVEKMPKKRATKMVKEPNNEEAEDAEPEEKPKKRAAAKKAAKDIQGDEDGDNKKTKKRVIQKKSVQETSDLDDMSESEKTKPKKAAPAKKAAAAPKKRASKKKIEDDQSGEDFTTDINGVPAQEDDEDEDELEEAPKMPAKKATKARTEKRPAPKKAAVKHDESEHDDDDGAGASEAGSKRKKPASRRKPAPPAKKPKSKKSKAVESDGEDD